MDFSEFELSSLLILVEFKVLELRIGRLDLKENQKYMESNEYYKKLYELEKAIDCFDLISKKIKNKLEE